MSRATWYRLGKRDKNRSGKTQAQIARQFQVSVRSLQRAVRLRRAGEDLAALVEAGKLNTAQAERITIEREQAALIAWMRAHRTE